jgi:rfaE bifunctional protein nucleotidyltransferase chain/domain
VDLALIGRRLAESAELHLQLAQSRAEDIGRAGRALAASLRAGGKVLFFGNGGSAADAQHLAAEFVRRFARDRDSLPALSLATDTSGLTTIGNDYGFDQVFDRQVRALGQPGDVAVAISASGRSPNVLAGARAARERGLTIVGLLGGSGGPLAESVDIPILVPSGCPARAQECHITVGHILCELVELALSTDGPSAAARPAGGGRAPKVVDEETLLALRDGWRARGQVVVWTNGCFDLFHAGHLHSLRAARRFGDVLVVGVNSDASVARLKGPGRPVVPAAERAEVVAALEGVDGVIVFDDLTPERLLSRLKPDVHCKGAEYAPPDGKPVPEARVVESYGGRIAYLPLLPAVSTTDRVRRIHERVGGGHKDEV